MVMGELYGGLKETEQEMWSRLAPFTTPEEAALAVTQGRVTDPQRKIRMANAIRTLLYLQKYQPKTPEVSGASKAGPPAKPPFVPWRDRTQVDPYGGIGRE